MLCNCPELVNAQLADRNMQLTQLFDLNTGKATGIVVATEKLDSKKKAGRVSLVAKFCPFCGSLRVPDHAVDSPAAG